MDDPWVHLSNARRKSAKIVSVARNGPAPASRKDDSMRTTLGSLDGDVSKLQGSGNGSPITASSQALMVYFAKLADGDNLEMVDFEFIDALVSSGADVNVSDAHGQGVLHEVARNWNPDVAGFLIKCGASVDKGDNWGRMPLHLAAAVNYPEMIDFLIKSGASVYSKTAGEQQSPIHYAAKYNAVGSLKALIEKNSDIGDRDYKGRTPLYLAAENGREEAARYLIELGVPCGVYSDSGMSVMALMIQKMPNVALDALKQYVIVDTAFRKEYFYLNYLEGDPKKWYEEYKRDLELKDNVYRSGSSDDNEEVILLQEVGEFSQQQKAPKSKIQAPSPLKVAVKCKELDILMHPVMQQLIAVKWERFGKLASIFVVVFHFVFLMIWTWLGMLLPPDNNFYQPPKTMWWRILLELIGCLMTLCFIVKQVWEFKVNRTDNNQWRQFRVKDVSRDLDYCHVRWPDEKVFIDAELKEIKRNKEHYFADVWNIMDCVMYACVISLILTRFLSVSLDNHKARAAHPKLYTFVLILMWLHFMKSCRPFTSLGPFILMLGHVISDTLRFTFLFFEFFIPFLCGFWIAFGGPVNAKKVTASGNEPVDWELFNNLMYSVWEVALMANFNFDAITSLDRLMAQALVGFHFMLTSIVCMNLYIALLSETFTRVYQNARANATLLQAATILQYESSLPDRRRRTIEQVVFLESAPLEAYQQPMRDGDDSSVVLRKKMTRQILNRISLCEDRTMRHGHVEPIASTSLAAAQPKHSTATKQRELTRMVDAREKILRSLQQHLQEIKHLLCQVYSGSSLLRPQHHPPGLLRTESKTINDDALLRRVLLEKMSDPMNIVPLPQP